MKYSGYGRIRTLRHALHKSFLEGRLCPALKDDGWCGLREAKIVTEASRQKDQPDASELLCSPRLLR